MAKNSIRRASKALEKDRLADFARTRDVTEAIYGNLRSFIGDRKARLTSGNARTMAKMQKLLGNMRVAERRTSGREQDLARRYGGALAGAAGQMMAPTEALAQGTTQAAKIGRNVSRYQANTGEQVLDIAASGATEAQASAEYATAQALAARTKEDVAMIAQMEHEVRMARIQHQQAMQRDQRMFRLESKRLEMTEEKEKNLLGEELFTGQVKPALQTLSSIVPKMREYLAADSDMELTDVVDRLVEEGIISEEERASAQALLGTAFRMIKNGGFQNLQAAETSISQALIGDLAAYAGGVGGFASMTNEQQKAMQEDLRRRLKLLRLLPKGDDGGGGATRRAVPGQGMDVSYLGTNPQPGGIPIP